MSAIARVSPIIVTFNSAGVIDACLKSLPPGGQVIVVDNASSDDSRNRAQALGAHVIPSDSNLGFGNACNLGAHTSTREFLFFLNPDAVVEPGALEALVAAADNNPDHAAFNPRLMRPDGRQFFRQRSHLFPETRRMKRSLPTEDQDIKVLSGAAVLMRRDVFVSLGGFDPKLFLYCEDDDLGLRILKAGYRIGYVHDAVVVHQGNESSAPSSELDRLKAYHEMRSRWYTSQKHGLPFSRVGQILQSASNYLSALVMLNSRAQNKHRGRMAAVLEGPPSQPET